jgi:hypothetical protein
MERSDRFRGQGSGGLERRYGIRQAPAPVPEDGVES